ncbi:MAG: glycosyltransferase family 2 protein [Flavobacterium sp.]|uniref:glycosyltransferase family 2 protein n=1 Tax=Flavobacterium sp. TaxID=239 RepID=UPI0022BBDAAF|nr:glycosyltransferase family 2 protein [Flavobacterium sp.]MCZ8196453.1 glycosyltransferase family 2 protein [Flavobacterium sp.]
MKISVALCTYNGEKYIQKQLDSILHQNKFSVDEIVICDDCSNDTTVEIIKEYIKYHPETIKLFDNETNQGSTKNFEKAIAICQGDYIFLSDQDDIWNENKIVETLKIFNENPKCEGVFTNASLINEDDKIITPLTLWDSIFFLENELQKPIDLFDIITKNGNIATGATLCIKNEVKEFIFPFSDEVLHDEWIAILLAIKKTLYYSTQNLLYYRIHGNQQVGVKSDAKLKKIKHKKRILLGLDEPKKYKDYLILSKKKWLKFNELEKLSNTLTDKYGIQNMKKDCYEEYLQLQKKIKIKFPVKYQLTKWIDTFLGKRKIKNL